MFAIFTTGGKQYRVQKDDVIFTEKLDGEPGSNITFDQVHMIDTEIGSPIITGAKVICEIMKQGKQDKIRIIKHISQKHHTKTQGHRQPYTKLVVKEIISK